MVSNDPPGISLELRHVHFVECFDFFPNFSFEMTSELHKSLLDIRIIRIALLSLVPGLIDPYTCKFYFHQVFNITFGSLLMRNHTISHFFLF